jgi:acetyl esterase
MSALDPEAAAVVQAMYDAGFDRPFREIGLEESRRLLKARPIPPAPAYDTRDFEIPREDGTGIPVRLYGKGSPGQPLLVWIHGGGFIFGDLSSGDATCRSLASKAGCPVLNIDYRLAPEHPYPAALDDVLDVLRWVGSDGEQYGLDATRIVVAGESAGAHLSACVSTILRDETVCPVLQVLICPSTVFSTEWQSMSEHADGPVARRDDAAWFWSQFISEEDRKDWRAAPGLAPLEQYRVPALVITADHDPLVDDGRAYARRLEEAGVRADYHEYTGVMHGFFRFVGVIAKADEAEAVVVDAIRSCAD